MKLIQKKGGLWWLDYRDARGKRHRESMKTTIKREAEAHMKQIVAAVETGTYAAPDARKVTVDALVAALLVHYRTERNKEDMADAYEGKWQQHLEKFFGGMKVEGIITETLRQYRTKRMAEKEPPSPTTVNRELQVIRKAFKLAFKEGKIRTAVPYFPMSVEDNARQTFMTVEVLDKIRTAASREGLWARFMVEMTYTVGCRKGEVLGLTVGDVNLEEEYIRIIETKNGDIREIPLTESLRLLVEPLAIGRDSTERLIPVKDPRCAWRRICKAAGVKAGKDGGYVLHDGRRTAPRRQRSAGVAQSVSMRQMGWRSDAMYRRYGIVDRRDVLDALEKTENFEKAAQIGHTETVTAPSKGQ